MIDNETTLIYCVGVHESPDSVPYDAMMNTIFEADIDDLRYALQEMYLIAAGLVGYTCQLLEEARPGNDVTPIEVIETHFAILKAATED